MYTDSQLFFMSAWLQLCLHSHDSWLHFFANIKLKTSVVFQGKACHQTTCVSFLSFLFPGFLSISLLWFYHILNKVHFWKIMNFVCDCCRICKLEVNNWSKCNNNLDVHKIAKNCLSFMNMSFYMSRYYFSQIFRTSFNIMWKTFVTNFPFLTDLLKSS